MCRYESSQRAHTFISSDFGTQRPIWTQKDSFVNKSLNAQPVDAVHIAMYQTVQLQLLLRHDMEVQTDLSFLLDDISLNSFLICFFVCPRSYRYIYEPRHEKTSLLHMRKKQRHRSAVLPYMLFSAFGFHCLDSMISLKYINPKFQASS